ncbi:MAG: CRISPR-associated protein Cas4 [Thermoplasmataceae archaeon]
MENYTKEEDYLMLSGIQHIAFCERQWALIHLEQQWQENRLTVEGKHIHEHADNPFENDTRKEVRITRSIPIESVKLGLRGLADVIEYIRDDTLPINETVVIKGRSGRWQVVPVEYKRGKPKSNDVDKVQLYAQAMCLEEMFNVVVKLGYLYYNSTKRREKVYIDVDLREKVIELSQRMHKMFSERIIPKPVRKKYCDNCSLYEICQPDWGIKERNVAGYISDQLYGGASDKS